MAKRIAQVLSNEAIDKTNAFQSITAVYHQLQKPALFAGQERVYRPKDEEGEKLPPESQRTQERVIDLLERVASAKIKHWDTTATKERSNTRAKVDVMVDEKKLLTDVPPTTLLFLDKQLLEVRSVIEKLPTLDPSEVWTLDSNTGLYKTNPAETVRTKKVPRNHVKAEATQHHPAQVEIFSEDIIAGTWTTTRFSGAIPAAAQRDLLARVDKLRASVKEALELANTQEAEVQLVGETIFDYLLAPLKSAPAKGA